MKKKRILVVQTLVMITLLLFAASTSQAAKTIKLSFATFFPPGHGVALADKMFIQEVVKRTNGQVQITFHPGGTLVDPAQTYASVLEGVVDIGFSITGYNPGRFPGNEVVSLPLNWKDGWVNTKVVNEFNRHFKLKEFRDTHPLLFNAHGASVLCMARDPVYKMEDLKGKVIRAMGTDAQLYKALGAGAHAAPMTEAYELLSKRVVDGSGEPLEPLFGWKHAEAIKYIVFTDALTSCGCFYMVMNNDVWNSLPPDIQRVFNEVSEEMIDVYAKVWGGYDRLAIDYFLSLGKGREIIRIPPEEDARWVRAVRSVVDAYIGQEAAKGIPLADYIDYIRPRIKYWSEQPRPTEKECAQFLQKMLSSGR